jgi:pimeloyl-ACP methyl ester carboxylesterase
VHDRAGRHDTDLVRADYSFDRWAVAGHSWGSELAVRYAARHPDHATAVAYIAGVGAGDDFWPAFAAERDRRLGPDCGRLAELSAIPADDRTPAQERERCLLQWRTDFSPGPGAAGHAQALWDTRPPGAVVNRDANRELWNDRRTEDLRLAAARVSSGPTTRALRQRATPCTQPCPTPAGSSSPAPATPRGPSDPSTPAGHSSRPCGPTHQRRLGYLPTPAVRPLTSWRRPTM